MKPGVIAVDPEIMSGAHQLRLRPGLSRFDGVPDRALDR